MPKFKHPQVKHALVAKGLLEGKSQVKAVREAGYSASTALKAAGKICQSPEVIEALRQVGQRIMPDHLDEVAKARLMGLLADETTDARSLVVGLRLAFELAGKVGAGKVEHQHYHQFSPETKEFFERLHGRKVLEGAVIEAEEA